MGLPKQIREQQEAAAAFDAQVTADREAAKPPEPTPPEPATPAPTPAPPPQPPVADEASLWKQRFLSLQGMFNQQVPALQQELKDVKETLRALQEARTATPEPPKAGKKLVTEQDVTAFGSDLIDVIRRGAQEELAAVAERHEARMTELQSQLTQNTQQVTQVAEVTAKSAQNGFFGQLEDRLPKWEQVQASAECQSWLGERIPGAQATWNDSLIGAAERHDVDAVVEVFDEFFKAHPTLRPGYKPAAPTPPAPRSRSELERQVTPTKSSASVVTTPTSKRTYSAQDYATESMKLIRLVQANKRDEAAALDLELNAALAENRVHP